jgi:hypothetical protein
MANSDDISIIIGVQAQSVVSAGKKLEGLRSSVVSLHKMLDKGTLSNAQYEKGLKELARANDVVLGSRQKSTAVIRRMKKEVELLTIAEKKSGKEVDVLASKMNRASTSASRLGNNMSLAGKRTNRLGSNMQQVGYQVGDFAVQVQGGTNVMVALGQQGAQLLGIFGAGGALAGAALAISTALLAPLFRSKKEAKGLVDEIKDLQKELNNLKGVNSSEGVLANQKLIGDAQEKILGLQIKESGILEEIRVKETSRFSALNDTINENMRLLRVQEEIKGLEEGRDEIYASIKRYNDLIHEKQKQMAASEGQRLDHEISMLQAKLSGQVTSENLKELEMQHAMEAYEADLNRRGLGQTIINQLIEQQKTAFRLANDLERADEADARRSARLKAAAVKKDPVILDPRAAGYDPIKAAFDKMQTEDMSPTKEKVTKTKTTAIKKDPVADFQKKLDLEREMLGVSEARQKVLQALGSDFARDNPKQAQAMEDQITKTNELIAVEEKRQGLVDSITGSIENGMMAMIDGTLSVKDAFKSMAAEIIKELYRVLVVKRLVGSFDSMTGTGSGLVGMIMGAFQANGGAWQGGSQIKAYADGGVVGGPTTFPMAGGKTGLMGEAGPEAIMPLKRGANGKLGVQMEGGSQGNVVINQSFNFQANGDDSVKKLIAQAAPKIADMAKASVIESRRRGGSTKAAFG